MAGSINLSLSQQFDITNGRLLSGGKLYFYSAGTTTPQLVYKDQALTIAHPNPITLESDGRIPAFYVADGSIRARLVNKAGVTQFDTDNIMVVGPSSGSGGGSSVDATTIFATGDVMWQPVSGTRSGWVRANGRTIGSATSGAAERANSDVSALYSFLWSAFPDTICAVSTGRGASAAADFAANKTIAMYDMRGKGPFGLDGMGNSRANIIADARVTLGTDADTAGASGGASTKTLSTGEIPAHNHTATSVDAGHTHSIHLANSGGVGAASNPLDSATGATGSSVTTTTGNASITTTINSTGGGAAFGTMNPFALGTWYFKI